MKTIVRIDAHQYENHDDCLTAAAEDYAEEHGLGGWDLDPRWENDDERDTILLSVPDVYRAFTLDDADVATLHSVHGNRDEAVRALRGIGGQVQHGIDGEVCAVASEG